MSVVQNYYLPMLERLWYAVRHSQRLCKFEWGIIPKCLYFLFFYCFRFWKWPKSQAISKPIMDIFLPILDENWLDDTKGRLVYRYSQKCIAKRYLFRVNRHLPVYCCTPISQQSCLLSSASLICLFSYIAYIANKMDLQTIWTQIRPIRFHIYCFKEKNLVWSILEYMQLRKITNYIFKTEISGRQRIKTNQMLKGKIAAGIFSRHFRWAFTSSKVVNSLPTGKFFMFFVVCWFFSK